MFEGESLLPTPAHKVIGRGIARTFQNLALFPSMTVLENVLVGSHIHRRPAADDEARALSLLDYMKLRRARGAARRGRCRTGSRSESRPLGR